MSCELLGRVSFVDWGRSFLSKDGMELVELDNKRSEGLGITWRFNETGFPSANG
jgi:hypothetical protein